MTKQWRKLSKNMNLYKFLIKNNLIVNLNTKYKTVEKIQETSGYDKDYFRDSFYNIWESGYMIYKFNNNTHKCWYMCDYHDIDDNSKLYDLNRIYRFKLLSIDVI